MMNSKPFYIERPLRVNGYDIDFGGIVSNIVYIRWLEDMRSQILDHYYPLEWLIRDRMVPVVIETHVHYRRQIKLFDAPLGKMWLSSMGRLRWQATAEIIVDGQIAFDSIQQGVFVSMDTGKPGRVPAAMLNAYQHHLSLEHPAS